MRLLAALASVLVLAGCVHPSPHASAATAPAPAAPAPRSLDWSMADCESISWSVPVQAAALRPYLPAGFEPRPLEGPGASVDGAATLTFRAVECSAGFGASAILRSVQSGWVATDVVPPANLREDRFGAHYAYGWDALVAPDAWRKDSAPWGLPLHDGGALVGPDAQGWSGRLAMDHTGAFTVQGRTWGAMAPAPAYESRTITTGAQGLAVWDAETTNRSATTGAGVWSVSADSWVASVLGATQGAATFQHELFSQPRAAVHWPGDPLAPTEPPSRGDPVGGTEPPPPARPVGTGLL